MRQDLQSFQGSGFDPERWLSVQLETPSTVTTADDLPANMSAEDLDKLRKDLDFMMAHYEGELKKPIRNLVSGRLPRTLLIQVRALMRSQGN